MKSISKRIIVLVVLLSLLVSSVPVPKEDTNSVHASSLTTAVTNPSESINASYGATVLINEVMFNPSEGNYEWLELKNVGPGSIDIRGYSLTDEDDNWYEIPDALPPVPEGAFVVVVFDGLGSSLDDYEFADNVAYLHSQAGLVNIFEDDLDQVSLYGEPYQVFLPLISSSNSLNLNQNHEVNSNYLSELIYPSPIKSFVAWGDDPLEDGSNATNAGQWLLGSFINVYGIGESPVFAIEPDGAVGLIPGSSSSYSDNFTIFSNSEITPGSDNIVPLFQNFHPADGSLLNGNSFTVLWGQVEGASEYHFQLDDNADFSSPLADLISDVTYFAPETSIPEGDYYWHVQVVSGGELSEWSPVKSVSSYIPSPVSQKAIDFSNPLGVVWQLQHKDTNMLCSGGCQMSGVAAWDIPHPATKPLQPHAYNYCERAAVAMAASSQSV